MKQHSIHPKTLDWNACIPMRNECYLQALIKIYGFSKKQHQSDLQLMLAEQKKTLALRVSLCLCEEEEDNAELNFESRPEFRPVTHTRPSTRARTRRHPSFLSLFTPFF